MREPVVTGITTLLEDTARFRTSGVETETGTSVAETLVVMGFNTSAERDRKAKAARSRDSLRSLRLVGGLRIVRDLRLVGSLSFPEPNRCSAFKELAFNTPPVTILGRGERRRDWSRMKPFGLLSFQLGG